MFFNGTGVEKDYAEAYAWLNIAAANSNAAEKARDGVGRKLSSAQVAEAQKRSEELKVLIRLRASEPE